MNTRSRAQNGREPGRDQFARARITRLGQGVDATGQLRPDAVERTLAALDAYAREAKTLSAHIGAVGTSASR